MQHWLTHRSSAVLDWFYFIICDFSFKFHAENEIWAFLMRKSTESIRSFRSLDAEPRKQCVGYSVTMPEHPRRFPKTHIINSYICRAICGFRFPWEGIRLLLQLQRLCVCLVFSVYWKTQARRRTMNIIEVYFEFAWLFNVAMAGDGAQRIKHAMKWKAWLINTIIDIR